MTLDEPSPQNKGASWKIYLKLMLLGIGAVLAIGFVQGFQAWLQQERTKLLFIGLDGMCWQFAILGGVILAGLLLALWIRPRISTLAIFFALLYVGYQGFFSLVRIDSYNGDRTPRFVWRWSPSPRDQALSHLVSANRSSPRLIESSLFAARASDYPGYRGPKRNGVISDIGLASDWKKNPPKLLWEKPVGIG